MKLRALLLIMFTGLRCMAQDADLTLLNEQRIATNKTGMMILGGWGAANVVSGIAGYAIADQQNRKAFHGMNALWGAVNGFIAIGGYLGAVKESNIAYEYDDALKRYKSNKKLYLINAGLDVVYIGTGVVLTGIADNTNNPEIFHGFGQSVIIQGAALLLFDSIMYGLHQSRNGKWAQLAGGISFTGNGIGYVYRF